MSGRAVATRRVRAAVALALWTAVAAGPASAAGPPAPDGLWVSFDHGRPRSHIRLQVREGELTGEIVRVFVNPGEPEAPRCIACTGALKDTPIEGLRIVSGMRLTDGVWSGGTILDPESGSVYTATVTVAPDGASLVARGYVGIPLFGRSVTWTRLP